MRPGAREKETAACSRSEGTSSAVSPSPGGLPLVLAVGRLSGRSSPGGCRWTPRGLRLPGLDATLAARRIHAVGSLGAPAGGAVQRFARTVPKLGTAQYKRIRFKCVGCRSHTDNRNQQLTGNRTRLYDTMSVKWHRWVRRVPLRHVAPLNLQTQAFGECSVSDPHPVCLASPDEAPIRSAYGRHPPRSATFGPGADVRDVTGEVGQQEAGKEWTAKRYTAVRRWVGACGNYRALQKVHRFAEHTWRKMLSSRSRAAYITWEAFERIKQGNPLPRPKLRLFYTDL